METVVYAEHAPGQTVLIMGGGSGVGSFGIQIAKLYNCVNYDLMKKGIEYDFAVSSIPNRQPRKGYLEYG